MKRRKQLLALSLAAIMVLGGVFNPGTVSSVRAEGAPAQQETVGNETAPDESAQPSTDAAAAVAPGSAGGETVSEGDAGAANGVTAPSVQPGTGQESEDTLTRQGTVSGGDALSSRETVTESVDLSGGLKAGDTYGDARYVNITVMEDMNVAAATVNGTDIGEVTQSGTASVAGDITTYLSGFSSTVTVAGTTNPVGSKNGAVPTGGAVVQFTAVEDCTVTIIVKKNTSKKFFFSMQGQASNATAPDESAFAQNYVAMSYDLEAGNTYYACRDGSKATIAGILYSHQVEKAPVEMETVTKSLDLSGGLKAGETYGSDQYVNITVLEDMPAKTPPKVSVTDNVEEVIHSGTADIAGDITNYLSGFSSSCTVAGTTNPVGSKNGGVPTAGAVVQFTAVADCTVTLVLEKNTSKKFFFSMQGQDANAEALDESAAVKGYVAVSYDLEAGNTYYACRDGSKATIAGILYSYQVEKAPGGEELIDGVIAFPGAEGGGMYATGGRGGDVYVVTTLEDYAKGQEAIPGSLRYGIESAPGNGRIIVFDVGGTIDLKQRLSFSGLQNISLEGQTAPGDGITIAGYDTDISNSKNLIFRFIHFRVGTDNLLSGGDSMDALWGRDNDTFMVDHCTFSWNTDETLSTYRGRNGTVQWCIVSESLTVSGHSKGRHGYGGIWGGDNVVFQYNLVANHTSRNPRIGGGSMGDPTSDGSMATLQLSNNVLYNYGYNNCYGGGYTYSNYINNYHKIGQGTRDNIKEQQMDAGEKTKPGGFYIAGNVVEYQDGTVQAYGDSGIKNSGDLEGDTMTVISGTPYVPDTSKEGIEFNGFDTITLRNAEEAYGLVLDSAGVTYPRRDAIDARVVNQVRTDTGTFINVPEEVGGYCAPEVHREDGFDTDGDGIPDAWETENGLNPNDPEDSKKIIRTGTMGDGRYGYSWIEVYANEMVEDRMNGYVASNPAVSIDLPDNTLMNEGDSVTVTASASDDSGIARVEFYNGNQLVGTADSAPYQHTYTGLADGTYHISVRAYDNNGFATQSNTSRLHVNSTAGTGEWVGADIGNPAVAGTASLVDGIMTVKGSGKLGRSESSLSGQRYSDATTDDFHYVYQQFTGDMELVTKLDYFTTVDNHTFNGIMFRESLDANSAAVGLGLSLVKIDINTTWSAYMVERAETGGNMSMISETIDSPEAAEKAGIPLVSELNFKEGNTYNGTWLKLSREGSSFHGFVSNDGTTWIPVGTLEANLPDTVYVGFAVDANKVANDLENYSTAKFSNIKINTGFVSIDYIVKNLEMEGAERIASGEDLSVRLTTKKGYLLPESVLVSTDKGEPVEFTYDKETGMIFMANVTQNIVVKAIGIKREVVKVDYEAVDEGGFLTVEDNGNGTITLTQTATTGAVAKNINTPAVNMSYILFPETTEFQTMSMKITIKELTGTNDKNNSGVFVGAFNIEGNMFSSLGFRPSAKDSLCGYWTKNSGNVGNGNPKQDVVLDTEYEVVFKPNGKGGYLVTWTTADGSQKGTKEFKANEGSMQAGDPVRYGIGLLGAKAVVSDVVLIDHEDNQIYPSLELSEIPEDESGKTVFDITYKGGLDDACGVSLNEEFLAYAPEGVEKIELRVSPVHTQTEIPGVTFDNAVAYDLSLYLDGIVWSTEFWTPVTVTMQIPEGVDKTRDILVYHIHEGEEPVKLEAEFDLENNTLSFTVNKFSTIVIANEKASDDDNSDNGNNDNDNNDNDNSDNDNNNNGNNSDNNNNDGSHNDDDDDDVDETGENVKTQATKTGDHMNVAAAVWSVILLAAVAGAGLLVYMRKRRSAGGEK